MLLGGVFEASGTVRLWTMLSGSGQSGRVLQSLFLAHCFVNSVRFLCFEPSSVSITLGAYRIPSETGLVIPSDFVN